MNITTNGIKLCFDEKTLAFAIQKKDGCVWKWDESYAPCLECEEGTLFFCRRRGDSPRRVPHRHGGWNFEHLPRLWG